ncbi:MAG TPA: rod shape-determining protein MreC [Acidimicrobiales bacterium]|nr:rod shape-determining protein MreC [Acidimicrobiales bacterium]
MPKPRRSRRTLTLVVLVVISLSIISLDLTSRTHSITSGIKSVANGVYSPLRGGVVDLLSPIGSFFAGALHYGSVQTENEKLQAQLGALRQELSEKSYEDTQLRTLVALQHLPFLGSLPTVTAQTVEVSSSNFTLTVTIDKGRSDGVDVGMPVVGAGGLVGQVVSAYHHTSVVQLLTDGQFKVGVTFGDNVTGTVDGGGPGSDLTVDLVPPHTPMHDGEELFTSSLEGASFPPGIPVARIESFHTISGASQATVTADPIADLSQLAYLDVVQWEPAPSP